MTDIFSILKSDHNLHREMLAKIAETSGDTKERRDLFEAFRIEVSAHAAAEEQSLYATMLADPDLQDDGRHSVAEHKEIDDLLGELQDTDMASGAWVAKFKEMRHRYEHHIDEEEDEMFPAAQKEFSKAQAEKLGATFGRRKPKELEVAEASDNGSDKD
ncbi:MAG: hemerythrin domain-containing protein [Sphingomonadaceae bacterium]|nr:hemerythrin domain-containing protein [Sphingomonadaceae bacterium]